MSAMFAELQLHRWRQFNEVVLSLDQRMTVLTGQNGTGKTTILNILGKHFGWNLNFVSTPLPISKQRQKKLFSDFGRMRSFDAGVEPGSQEVGSIRYQNGPDCTLMAPPHTEQPQYGLTYQHIQQVAGLHIPSHRPTFAYHRIESIPIDPQTTQQQYQNYYSMLMQLYQSDRARNPGNALKQSLISFAVFGYGNEAVAANPRYAQVFEGFQEVLRVLLPRDIGFQRLEIRVPDIVLITDTGEFSLDAASGGIGAIVGIAWQVFMYAQDEDDFVVTIDEPEDHLHPSMQREILPNLLKAFPQTQFVISTHSPFVVTSTPEAAVHALTYNDDRRVDSHRLETCDLTGSANETLREILGVPMSIPVWVEDRFREITDKYRSQGITDQTLEELRRELKENGLGSMLPEALANLGDSNA